MRDDKEQNFNKRKSNCNAINIKNLLLENNLIYVIYFSSERRHYDSFPDFTPSSDANLQSALKLKFSKNVSNK